MPRSRQLRLNQLSRWRGWFAHVLAASRRIATGSIRWNAKERRTRAHFDDSYYQQTYDDVAGPDFPRFQHFMEHGWREGRNPSAAFHTLYYRDVHLGGAFANPLLHYVEKGVGLGLSIRTDDDSFVKLQAELCASYFSEAFYRRASGYEGKEALIHYLREGWRRPGDPSSLFDSLDYVDRHRFLAKHDVSPLYHLASQRRSAGEATPLSPDLLSVMPPGSLVERIGSPLGDLKPPRLLEIDAIPAGLKQELAVIWQSGTTGGEAISTYRFKDVYITGEGLVFTDQVQVIGVTESGHTRQAVREGALAIATAQRKGYETIEAGILTTTRGAGNYGHFILEMLPRAWFARTRLGFDWPAIIQRSDSPIEQVCREALRRVGFDADEIIAVGREPVFVRDLIVVDGLARHPLYISPTILQCFDEIADQIPAGRTDKVYAARGASSLRDFIDEKCTAAQLASAGFHRATTGDMTFDAQVALFKGASHVLGIGGAALTNLLFCRPGTRVTILSPASASEVLFWLIAELRGLDYEEVRCREAGPRQGGLSWNRAIDVAADELSRLLA